MGAPTVLITGGTGFIALEIGHQLLTAGEYRVRATVRSLQKKDRNRPLLDLVKDPKQGPPELVEADLLSADGW
jgi:nucleoside-diphosphate-sugar epimerase